MPLTKSAMAPMRYGDIASPNAWLTKICVALAKLRRVGMTIYSVISLTMAQLQLRSNPGIRNEQLIHLLFPFYKVIIRKKSFVYKLQPKIRTCEEG